MRIQYSEDNNSLELRSGGGAQSCLGLGIGLFGFVFACFVGGSIFWAHYQSERMPTPWWILAMPLFFLGFGILSTGGNQRNHAHLARYGQSHSTLSKWFGLQKEEQTFDAAAAHHLHLHTEERITRNKNGTSRYRVSHLAVVMRDGSEVLIGKQRRSGLGGQQPLLEQAGEIALFLGVPLERTGIGAPIGYDLPPGGASGSPQQWGGPLGQAPGHSYQQFPSYGPPGPGGYPPRQSPGHGAAGHQHGPGGQNPGDGGGLPDWIRGQDQ
ncbi:hypothetical protein [Nesterenkonia ebinurensis]|uniref:hypothetical protein n=1 Tax=Nesterenkonia ebinurensis TaxID=2608252 RepID=UPI00123D8759|nr:hypothetical protein [Nesterenkonia ebinurensis]